MHYYTYVIHHPLGLYYVGCRQSKLPPEQDTKYWGSSKVLKKIRKQALPNNWTKEILSTHSNREQMLSMEYELTCPSISTDKYAGVNAVIINRVRGGSGWNELTESARAKISAANLHKVMSNEARAKMSIAKKGRKLSEETRAKIGAAFKGCKLSEEHIAKRSAALRGRKASEEHIANLRAAHQRRREAAKSLQTV